MKVEIHFKPKFVEKMKSWFGSFENPKKIYGVQNFDKGNDYLKITIFDTRCFRMEDIEKVLVDGEEV